MRVHLAIAIDSSGNVCVDHIIDPTCESDIGDSVDKVALNMAQHHAGNLEAKAVAVRLVSVEVEPPAAYSTVIADMTGG